MSGLQELPVGFPRTFRLACQLASLPQLKPQAHQLQEFNAGFRTLTIVAIFPRLKDNDNYKRHGSHIESETLGLEPS